MARIYTPRQRSDTKRWDMTVGSDEERWVHPIGYCAGWHEWTEESANRIGMSLESCLKDQEKLVPFRDKFHTDGHDTATQADECYRQYELDVWITHGVSKDQQQRCQVCGEWTGLVAELGHEFRRRFWLCEEHRTRENIAKLDDGRRSEPRVRSSAEPQPEDEKPETD